MDISETLDSLRQRRALLNHVIIEIEALARDPVYANNLPDCQSRTRISKEGLVRIVSAQKHRWENYRDAKKSAQSA